ncbi:matrixin family metalloprotease [Flavobacterium sp. N1718]|uniref:matrixin family metalloprotease n=1 Tax=Flavobacterium sp. N1718 TaxID=2986822 RepID=UPI0022257CB5|nr:matrixin family metalloprotease [Flavobacterium sp. N1718]
MPRATATAPIRSSGAWQDGRKTGRWSSDLRILTSVPPKNNVKDWGVMGLGYHPGAACVVSDFRLRKHHQENQLYKVVLHELGHTEGLPHCPKRSCIMRDAEGKIPLQEEKAFCSKCRAFLNDRQWRIP